MIHIGFNNKKGKPAVFHTSWNLESTVSACFFFINTTPPGNDHISFQKGTFSVDDFLAFPNTSWSHDIATEIRIPPASSHQSFATHPVETPTWWHCIHRGKWHKINLFQTLPCYSRGLLSCPSETSRIKAVSLAYTVCHYFTSPFTVMLKASPKRGTFITNSVHIYDSW